MKLTFWGAARQVTGSMFLLQLDSGYKILIDCGTDLSKGRTETPVFPFYPSEVNLVLLTHAHLDHCGNIPNLIMNGYKGQIICTPPTFALTQLILQDSALIHSRNIKRKLSRNKYKSIRNEELDGVYLQKQVDDTVDQFFTIRFNKRFEINEDLFITFIPTGHLLGAGNILIEVREHGEWKRIGFSGDIGRKNYPLLEDPSKMPEVDYLVCETTYGERTHSEGGNTDEMVYDIIKKACVDTPGRLIIPAFSVGRTQALLYTLKKLSAANRLPKIKVFADSPMAEESTRIYEDYLPLLNQEANDFYEKNQGLFDFDTLVQVRTSKESKQISNHVEPCIVISSSGMLTGGRVENHLQTNLSNPYCTVLMVGYSAQGTPGHQLLHEKTITIKGRRVPVMANIISTDLFSGHGDRNDLREFIRTQDKSKLRKVFLVHGEYESMIGFKKYLEEDGYSRIEIPKKGESYDL